LLGGLELGGTTIKVCLAEGTVTNVIYQQSHPTKKPAETLQIALDFFRAHPIVALGIGSFGPVDLNPASPHYGHITTTPKLAWVDFDVVGFFSSLSIPISFNTDVNGAALAELQWGGHDKSASYPIRNVVYVTVGTGIGAGVVVDGKAVSGLLHPEAGHFRVPRHPDDQFKGNCPYHGDCLEGLGNAGAIASRCNVPPSQLHTIPDSHPVWDIEAFYLANLCQTLATIVSPHLIVLGGGVLKRKCLYGKVRQQLLKINNGYLRVEQLTVSGVDKYVVQSPFDAEGSKTSAGCMGVLELARLAYEEVSTKKRTKAAL
jgi:fructokinase